MSGSGDADGLTASIRAALEELLLTLADDEFVLGFWDSEWTGIAPQLEEDVAMSSLATDELGHARADDHAWRWRGQVSDEDSLVLAREVAKKIETDMQYPGQIRVTVIRETRATELAR